MLPPVTYLPVHWVNGMKISKDHFIQQEHAYYDQLRDLASIPLNQYNFGLLPATPEAPKSLDIRLVAQPDRTIHARLLECRAITRGGARIEILSYHYTEDNPLSTVFTLEGNDQLLLDVIIMVNPFVRVPTGTPHPEETPLRYPYTRPEYTLEIIPSDQLKITHLGTYHLTIGKIRVMGNEVKLLEQFIPACTSILAHPMLTEFCNRTGEACHNLYIDVIQIIKKIKDKSIPAALTDHIASLCQTLAFFLADYLDYLSTTMATQPPVALILLFKRLARLMATALNCMSSADREELLKYFADWSELSPGSLENALKNMVDMEYNHLDIASAAQVSEKFLLTIGSLFDRLNQLEFIGKPKEAPKEVPKASPMTKQSLFINEEPEKGSHKKKSLWNF